MSSLYLGGRSVAGKSRFRPVTTLSIPHSLGNKKPKSVSQAGWQIRAELNNLSCARPITQMQES